VTREFADLPPDWQSRISEMVEAAPQLTDDQRQRLQLLFRGSVPGSAAGEP